MCGPGATLESTFMDLVRHWRQFLWTWCDTGENFYGPCASWTWSRSSMVLRPHSLGSEVEQMLLGFSWPFSCVRDPVSTCYLMLQGMYLVNEECRNLGRLTLHGRLCTRRVHLVPPSARRAGCPESKALQVDWVSTAFELIAVWT